jgi:hypothetical protein
MIFEDKKYEEQEYAGLVNQLLLSEDIEKELQHARRYTLRSNQKMFHFLFRAVATLKETPNESLEVGQQNLKAKLDELELRLAENTNIIPADLPDSILYDRSLSGNFLADHNTINFLKEEWNKFQTYIREKMQSIPQDLELPFLEWCEKMLKLNYNRHLKTCKKPIDCPQNLGYDRRIQYISRLIGEANAAQFTPAFQSHSENSRKLGNKIQWCGTQKELAELFVELKKKGWIEKIENDTIQDCFTESNSVPQYLKPATNTKTGEDTYENLYTGYSPQFYGIKENSKRRK